MQAHTGGQDELDSTGEQKEEPKMNMKRTSQLHTESQGALNYTLPVGLCLTGAPVIRDATHGREKGKASKQSKTEWTNQDVEALTSA